VEVFDARDLGEVGHLLNILVQRDRKNRPVWLNKGTYAKSVVDRVGMQMCAWY
jgi:hypothetical protein